MRRAQLTLLALALHACAAPGPASVAEGRSAYNAVINATEDQQILSMIVRLRYDESFGMLSVSNVTASLRLSASATANIGIGPDSSFEGNLVPLSIGGAYEENPVISYVPMRGEQFVQRMLAPITAEQALLLERMSNDQVEALRILVRRANGLANPLFSPAQAPEQAGAFERFVELYGRLRDRGELDVVRSDGDAFQILIHDSDRDSEEVDELLATLGIRAERGGEPTLAIPLRFFVGSARGDALDLETPSALEVIEAAGLGVEVPADHVAAGLARAATGGGGGAFLRIRSSPDRPRDAAIAVPHRGWWFFIEARDAPSKRSFLVLRTLIGLRLDEASDHQPPLITVPVGG